MKVRQVGLDGAFVIEGVRIEDTRGDFRRLCSLQDLSAVDFDVRNSYLASAHNVRAGTVRGLHYQRQPHEETKVLWCHSGSLYDVLVDVRPSAPTFGRWVSLELSAEKPEVVHVPPGVAHGYQTTSGHSGVTYLISGAHEPSSSRTIHWRDKSLAIPWPLGDAIVSETDAAAPPWSDVG
ncbi:MAG TPA: dTDP-4-dehydrorhamnose 3,5-epimerase family protein [Nocardioides sp.]|uniref:dTDP-4-dehydrorhamnose 3,5-epimerase family protein n=1 Tax=Nocardioides sp. TaxID=35761 RepID=UPI002F3F2C9E